MNKPSGKYNEIQLTDGWNTIVARDFEEIEAIRPIWEKIQDREPYPVPNADIDQYLSVVDSMKESVKPYVMVLSYDGTPEAMVIGRIEEHRVKLRLGYKTLFSPKLKCLTVVYGGILGQPKKEVCSLLIRRLLRQLQHQQICMIYFNHLRTDSHIYQLSRKLPGILTQGYFPEIENHWSMTVPNDIDQFYRARSKKHRANLKRYIRKLEKEYPNRIKVITYSQEADLDNAIKAAAEISQSTYQHGLGCGFTDDSRTRYLLTQAARKGWLRMSVLYIDGQASAFQIGHVYRRAYKLAEIGFDPKLGQFNIGTVLFLEVLEEICANQNIESFDFGFGDANYKQSYGSQKWQEASVYIFAPRLYPVLVNMLRTSVTALNSALEYALNKTGIEDRIKRYWRNLLQAKNPESKC